jgi:hypothetical protein
MAIVGDDSANEMDVQPVVVAPANSNLSSDIEQPSNMEKNDAGSSSSSSESRADNNERDPTLADGELGVDTALSHRLKEVFLNFAPLGLVAFGGPTAHVAILHERFVESKRWLDDEKFVELLAVGQGLPGPTSTQMVIATGTYSIYTWSLSVCV